MPTAQEIIAALRSAAAPDRRGVFPRDLSVNRHGPRRVAPLRLFQPVGSIAGHRDLLSAGSRDIFRDAPTADRRGLSPLSRRSGPDASAFAGRTAREVVLGTDILAGQHPQVVVPAGVWQGSRLEPGVDFALLGATMAPGFDYADYEQGRRSELTALYPDVADLIRQLTRNDL